MEESTQTEASQQAWTKDSSAAALRQQGEASSPIMRGVLIVGECRGGTWSPLDSRAQEDYQMLESDWIKIDRYSKTPRWRCGRGEVRF